MTIISVMAVEMGIESTRDQPGLTTDGKMEATPESERERERVNFHFAATS